MRYLKSLAELTGATYATSFLGLLLAAGFDLTDISAVRAAAVASVPAGLAVVYGALARYVGDHNSALATSDTRRLH